MSYTDILRKRAEKAQKTKVVGKLHPYQIIGTPLITEKAYKGVEDGNTYVFRVHQDATKPDIKASLQYIYNVTPLSIRIVHVPYKGRNHRKLVRRAYKKALVRLRSGDKIELAA